MDSDNALQNESLSSRGSVWGGLGGLLLGVAFAVTITSFASAPLLFMGIVGGISTLGMVFGNAMNSLLSNVQEQPVRDLSKSGKVVTGAELEQSSQLIDHLRLREEQVKKRLDSQCIDLQRGVEPKPSFVPLMSAKKDISPSHIRDILNKKPDSRGPFPVR